MSTNNRNAKRVNSMNYKVLQKHNFKEEYFSLFGLFTYTEIENYGATMDFYHL